jgi:glycolate oxidase
LKTEQLAALQELMGASRVLSEPIDLIPYGFDGTAALNQPADVVVLPESAEQVAALVRWAAQEKIPIVPRGSGTGLSGGSVPVSGGLVLCLAKLNRILEVDAENLTLLAEPGVITQHILEAAEKQGLFYPPDPSSMKISTIGGNVANNSGGLRGLKYGVTRDYVMGMEVVLPNGEIVWLGGKCVKDVAGYSLKDLFVGSEGTLGIMTKVLLKLVPKPASKRTLLALYDRLEDAAATVSAIVAAKLVPCTLEFLDSFTLRCVEDYAKVGLPTDVAALLLMETDGHPVVTEEEAKAMEAIAHRCGAREVRVAKDAQEALEIARARRSAFSALARIKPTTILEDVTVPRNKLVQLVRAIEAIAKQHNLPIAIFGHMGDGNLHPTFLTDERNHEEMARVEKAMEAIFVETIKLGGTITGEHGVGLAKKPYLHQQFQDGSYALLKTVKRALDPQGLLNPGKIFDL